MPWKRRPFGSNDLSRALNIADLREIARRRVPGFAFEYVEGGAEDEVTLRANREALERLRLIPQTLVDTISAPRVSGARPMRPWSSPRPA
jgi:(S)-mandelate dehydrogenase